MKKFFNHTKKPIRKWVEREYENESYDWDEEAESEEYYAEEGEAEYYESEEGEYYAEEGEAEYYESEEGEYYAEEGEAEYYESEEGEYYAEEGEAEYYESEEGEYYAEEGEAEYYESEEGEYYAEEGEAEYYESEEGEYYAEEDDDRAAVYAGRKKQAAKKSGFAAMLGDFFALGTMDKVVGLTGILVMVLVLITGGVFISSRMLNKQVSGFANVGTQLEGIDMIGEQGLVAVTDALIAKLNAAEILENENTDYNENDYNQGGAVVLNMVSIQKDLKIKFTNQKTEKLIANVPFSVAVTGPDGNTENWTDDDMDGIIYKKGITPGKYKIAVNPFAEGKYKDYILPTITETVEVKKEIVYEKVDVKNEIKKESEVNASKEDTKKNETVVESALTDTVQWVESTVTSSTYVEVDKAAIPDPMKLLVRGAFLRTSQMGGASVSGGDLTIPTPTPTPTPAPTPTLTHSPTPSATPSPTPSASPTVSPSPTVAPLAKGTVAVTPANVIVATGAKASASAAVSGFTTGKELVYSVVSSNTAAATADIDANGNITVTGVAKGEAVITVTVDYKTPGTTGVSTAATASFKVTVTEALAVTLDKTALTVFVSKPEVLTATVSNAAPNVTIPVTAESSDTTIAQVEADGKTVTVNGLAAGSATITVKYVENGIEVKATCAVTVKAHPKEDKTNKLKDADGVQLYVLEDNKYREAVYADYYTASAFFRKGAPKYTGWQTLEGKVYFFDATGKKLTGEQVIQGAKYNFASDGVLITGDNVMGIDVSKWNGTIDWSAVKNSGISYVIIRCGYRGSSQGALIEDPKFESNIKGATNAGLKVGVYFFTQALDEVEAVEEASMVLELVKNYKISYPIFLDVEPSGGRADKIDKAARTAVCKAFCETIEDAGYKAGIYANKTWLNEKMDAGTLSSYKIWLAQYAATPSYSGKYDMWQYSKSGRVSGISGDVDLNISYLGY